MRRSIPARFGSFLPVSRTDTPGSATIVPERDGRDSGTLAPSRLANRHVADCGVSGKGSDSGMMRTERFGSFRDMRPEPTQFILGAMAGTPVR